MRLPVLAATVERRLLVNYRVDAELVARLLPAGPRPQVLGGAAVAGICLTRLARVRPGGLPGQVGIRTENAAHRIAVCWDDPAGGPPRAGGSSPSGTPHPGQVRSSGAGSSPVCTTGPGSPSRSRHYR